MSDVSFPPVTAYVPHRGAMLLIDRVVAVDADQVPAELVVPEEGWTGRDGGVPAWIGVEYMAQAIAAFERVLEISVSDRLRSLR